MSLHLDPILLTQANQNRGKVFSWSQHYYYTGLLPSQINHILNSQNLIDPLWFYTQSGKNYTNDNLLLSLYSRPSNFELFITPLGLSNRLLSNYQYSNWKGMLYHTQWYTNQRYVQKFTWLLYLIPGIHKIYLVGSSQQEISKQNSDIDIAIECHKNWVLSTRLWLKFLLKLIGKDVHPFWLEILHFYYHLQKNHKSLKKIEDQIWLYKSRWSKKIDAGLLFEDSIQVSEYFEQTERNLWIMDRSYIPKFFEKFDCTNFESESTIYQFTPTNTIQKYAWQLLRLLLTPLFILTFPIAMLQLLWSKIRHVSDKQLIINYRFCCFYPRYPSYTYLTKLKA